VPLSRVNDIFSYASAISLYKDFIPSLCYLAVSFSALKLLVGCMLVKKFLSISS